MPLISPRDEPPGRKRHFNKWSAGEIRQRTEPQELTEHSMHVGKQKNVLPLHSAVIQGLKDLNLIRKVSGVIHAGFPGNGSASVCTNPHTIYSRYLESRLERLLRVSTQNRVDIWPLAN